MNYLSIYNSIIQRAISENRYKKNRSHTDYVYYERHHIIPRCMGGTNDKFNLVLLTGREHFLAHQLLVKIYPAEHKLVFALRSLCGRKNKYHSRNNREYEWIKILHAEKMSLIQKGKQGKGYKFKKGHTLSQGNNNGMYGKNHTQETKDLQSEKAKERDSSTYNFLRIPKTDIIKEKISRSKTKQKYKLISPNNKEYIFEGIKDASIYSGISISVLVKLAGNRYMFDHCRNWKILKIPL